MSRPRLRHFASRLAIAWHDRWLRVAALLRRDPPHADAWLWELEARILGFLLNRYGDQAGLCERLALTGPDPRIAAERTFGTPPRSREAIRIILERIVAANQM